VKLETYISEEKVEKFLDNSLKIEKVFLLTFQPMRFTGYADTSIGIIILPIEHNKIVYSAMCTHHSKRSL
jgi:hypothetical protein